MRDIYPLAIIAVATLFGNTIAVIAAAVLNAHYARRSDDIAWSTHKIVNSQRTKLLRLVAALSVRIAKDNPNDVEALTASLSAIEDADGASKAEL